MIEEKNVIRIRASCLKMKTVMKVEAIGSILSSSSAKPDDTIGS
jgi:hypothetical protein